MTVFVLDNSISMRWCFEDGDRAKADAVLHSLGAAGAQAVVPPLWPYEVSAVVARAQQTGALDATRAATFFDTLSKLPITIESEAAARIFTDVHDLALTYRLTTYDAAYLELALRRGLPLASLDQELMAAATRAGVQLL